MNRTCAALTILAALLAACSVDRAVPTSPVAAVGGATLIIKRIRHRMPLFDPRPLSVPS